MFRSLGIGTRSRFFRWRMFLSATGVHFAGTCAIRPGPRFGAHRVAITYDQVKSVAAELYGACLMKIPDDTKDALRRAHDSETNDGDRKILALMLRSALTAEETRRHVCSDAGVPVYFVKIGTAARLDGPIKQAISDGFDHLVATI